MYAITLSKTERKAIDWVGHRYSNGDDLRAILMSVMADDEEWDADNDITFNIPEHKAWEIKENAEKEDGNGFPCFSATLTNKFLEMLDSIV